MNKKIPDEAARIAREGNPEYVVLWDVRAADVPAARAAGLMEVDHAEYQALLAATVKRLEDDGHDVRLLQASAAEVIAFMQAHGLGNTPAGRAEAYTRMWFQRRENEA